jgi:hypothetical protein
MFSLLPLLGKKVEDLSLDDLSKVAKVMKLDIDVTDELRDAGLALLKGENIEKVADLIQSPDSVQKLLAVFQTKKSVALSAPGKQVLRCPHCELFFF